QLNEPRDQLRVALGPARRRPVAGGVVGARSHLQRLADGLDPEPTTIHEIVLVGRDERDYLRCWRSSSAPKKVAARRRISLARRSSRTSCSSSRSFSDSVVVTPGRAPS